MFPATGLGFTNDTDGSWWPTVVIDVAARPDVADLARVHAVEGIGDIATSAVRLDGGAASVDPGPPGGDPGPAGGARETVGDDLLLLGVKMTSPVLASFAVAFVLPGDSDFLRSAAERGSLVLATTDTDAAETDRPFWLAIDLDGPALVAML